ncbi:MAG: P1 family peptidase, partial [Sphingomonadaceae bacterium]
GAATTIAVVAVSAALTPAQARRVAIMAQDGIARAVRPAHTPFDGDLVFALALPGPAADAGALARIGSAAADVLARAIARGVWAAGQARG